MRNVRISQFLDRKGKNLFHRHVIYEKYITFDRMSVRNVFLLIIYWSMKLLLLYFFKFKIMHTIVQTNVKGILRLAKIHALSLSIIKVSSFDCANLIRICTCYQPNWRINTASWYSKTFIIPTSWRWQASITLLKCLWKWNE